jgi:hypothetical protein
MTEDERTDVEFLDEELSVFLADWYESQLKRIIWEDPEDDSPVSIIGVQQPPTRR